jgi:GDPmannose 4,6-dehydratase
MRALITGVTGQDGWYLSSALRAEGVDVFGLVAPGDATGLPPGVVPLPGDLRDASSLRSAVAAAEPDEVYNLAAISSVAQSWHEPEAVADVNGVGVVRLLEAVQSYEAAQGTDRRVRVVQAGSAEIFGDAPAPQDENVPIAPGTPYGAAKAYAHHVVRAYRSAGAWAANAILYNHESPRRPPAFVTRKITLAVAAIAAGRGDQLVLGNLDARRDWGYAGDYADALRRIARHPEPRDFVIATGVSHSIADFVRAAFAEVGITDWSRYVSVDPALQRAGDADEQRGDATLARTLLGWTPSVDFAGLVKLMVDADRAALASAST